MGMERRLERVYTGDSMSLPKITKELIDAYSKDIIDATNKGNPFKALEDVAKTDATALAAITMMANNTKDPNGTLVQMCCLYNLLHRQSENEKIKRNFEKT